MATARRTAFAEYAQQTVVDAIAVQIIVIEKEIDRIISQNPELTRLQKLLTGITGA